LTRPLPRGAYLLGRFLGLVASVAASMAVMVVIHLALLAAKGWGFDLNYFWSLPFMVMKMMVMSSLAIFFSVFSTSAAASVVFTLFFWMLGHFGHEMRYLADKSGEAATRAIMSVVLWLAPRLSALNYRDVFGVPQNAGPAFLPALGYTLLYSGAALLLTLALFKKKEF
jgi:Cu-processing system permease protein